jgi:hypothetical protein
VRARLPHVLQEQRPLPALLLLPQQYLRPLHRRRQRRFALHRLGRPRRRHWFVKQTLISTPETLTETRSPLHGPVQGLGVARG